MRYDTSSCISSDCWILSLLIMRTATSLWFNLTMHVLLEKLKFVYRFVYTSEKDIWRIYYYMPPFVLELC